MQEDRFSYLGSSTNRPESHAEALRPCPFCGGTPSTIERPDNIDGTEFVYAVACYCGGYSACAHKMKKRKTPEQAKADTIAAWNERAQPSSDSPASGVERSNLPDLHSAIMNLPCKPYDGTDAYTHYCRGHRDARHAAAELALSAQARITELEEALRRISKRCQTSNPNYTIASVGDAARAALKEPAND